MQLCEKDAGFSDAVLAESEPGLRSIAAQRSDVRAAELTQRAAVSCDVFGTL